MHSDLATSGASPGDLLGGYRIERLLGRGGMGTVFLAYDTTLGRQVALKLVDAAGDFSMSRAQVLREGRNAAALNHPNICTIHEVGDAGGAAFIAMEYVEGRSLRERLDEGPLAVDEALRHGIEAADAVAYAHEHGVVHRDLKTANVIVNTAGRIKIVDFGLARRSDPAAATGATTVSGISAGSAAGTPYAMAPEQVRGEQTDTRTDVWAIGVLLHEMMTATHPFSGATLAELFSAILRDPPAPLPGRLPPAIELVIQRCLAKDPAHRYQHAGEIGAALQAIATGAAPAPPLRPRWRWAMAAAALAAAGAIALVLTGTAGSWWRAIGTGAPTRLAVLPFRNLTGDPAQEVFSDGLTEEMIAQLGRIRTTRLRVISSRSSSRYKGGDAPLERIGRDLAVDYVLEGSARREGSRVRVTAALIHVGDQSQRWTDSFERDVSGMLGLESDIARGVVNALSLALLPADKSRLDSPQTVDPVAYEAYLKGLGHATRFTRPDFDRALEYFERASAKDPSFALAYLGIAHVWAGRQQMQFSSPAEAAPRLRAAVDAARRLDPDLPEVHFRLAIQYTWTDWNWRAAEPEFRRAIDLRPDYPEARAFYAHYLLIMHRPVEAMEQAQRAIRADPLNDEIQSLYGVTLMMFERYDEALAQFSSALRTASRSPIALNGLARGLHHMGRLEEALPAERAVWAARDNTEMVAALDRGAREGGYHAALRSAADTLAARSLATGTAPLSLGHLYLRAGDKQKAIDWAERAFAAHDPNIPYIAVGPHWRAVRSDPRMAALVRRLGLPE